MGHKFLPIKPFQNYAETEISSRPVTTVANAHVQSSESMTLNPGIYLIGYSVPGRLTDLSGGSNTWLAGAVTFHDGTTQVDGAGSIISFSPTPANTNLAVQMVGQMKVEVTVQTTYTLDIICSDSLATGTFRIEDTSPDSGNGFDSGGPTNASKMWYMQLA